VCYSTIELLKVNALKRLLKTGISEAMASLAVAQSRKGDEMRDDEEKRTGAVGGREGGEVERNGRGEER